MTCVYYRWNIPKGWPLHHKHLGLFVKKLPQFLKKKRKLPWTLFTCSVFVIFVLLLCVLTFFNLQVQQKDIIKQTLAHLSILAFCSPLFATMEMGKRSCKICLRTPITCSTYMHTSDSSLLQSTWTFSSCFFPRVNGGLFYFCNWEPCVHSHCT